MVDHTVKSTESQSSGNSRSFRIALIGCGEIAHTHLRYLGELPEVEVVGACDLAMDRAEELAEIFQIPACYDDLGRMLDEARPDVLHVLTPPSVSPRLAIQALERGIHVLVEKPMARTVAETRQMIEAAARGHARLGVDHSRLLHPSVVHARNALATGQLGDLVSVEVVQGYNAAAVPPGHWFHSYPWGILEDLLPHSLYLCRSFSGEPADMLVQASNANRVPPAPFDDLRIAWRGERATGQIILTLAGAPERNTITLRGTRSTLVVDTNQVTETLHRDLPLPWVLRKGAVNLDLAWQYSMVTVRNLWHTLRGELRSYPEIRATLRAFYEALAQDSALPTEAEDGARIVELMESVRGKIEEQARWLDTGVSGGDEEAAPLANDAAMPAMDHGGGPSTHPRIFLVGGTGLVGRAVIQQATAAGYPVTILVRPSSHPPADLPAGVRLRRGDLSSEARLQEELAGHDVVINAAGVLSSPHGPRVYREGNIDGPCRLVRAAAAAGASYMVHLSSAGIYGIPDEVMVTEDSPLEPHPERRGLYTATKLEGEHQVRQAAEQAGIGLGILRPTVIYGPGVDLPLGLFQVGSSHRALMIGSPGTPFGLTHAGNVADAVLACMGTRRSGIWNVIDDEDLTLGHWLDLRRSLRGEELHVAYLPLPLALTAAWMASRIPRLSTLHYRLHRTCTPFRLSAERLRSDLNWSPRISLASSLTSADLSGKTA